MQDFTPYQLNLIAGTALTVLMLIPSLIAYLRSLRG